MCDDDGIAALNLRDGRVTRVAACGTLRDMKNRLPLGQHDPMGCSVACVAFVTNSAYANALKWFPFSADACQRRLRGAGFLPAHVEKALASAGRPYRRRRFGGESQHRRSTAESLAPGAIVFVRRWNEDMARHYVVKTPGGWMDPMEQTARKKSEIWRPQRGACRPELPKGWTPISYMVPQQ